MWRYSQRPLSTALRIHPSKTACRFVHKGLSKLDRLAAEIMAGNDSASQQQSQSQAQPDYSTWSTTSLIERISELERQLNFRTAEYTSSPVTPAPASTNAQEATNPTPTPQSHEVLATQEDGDQDQSGKKIPKWLATGKYDPNNITHAPSARPRKTPNRMDPTKYNFRHIALKFAYLGQRYQGLEHANGNVTELPTIEEEMWKAMRRTRLIFPTDMDLDGLPTAEEGRKMKRKHGEPFFLSWEGCEYSKAGRTDRGVSAFGQVIGIKVRSARPKRKEPVEVVGGADGAGETTEEGSKSKEADDDWDDIRDELPYVNLLNKVLPEDIRVLAWCPHLPEGWDARFSCRERHYKYFFTQPAFSPTPGPLGLVPRASRGSPEFREGWLDIDAMREAARHFEGVHDFRNFCKVDTSKQIENFERIVYRADIELLDPKTSPLGYVSRPEFQASDNPMMSEETQGSSTANSQVYVFNLQGSAFLWHQVRHMVGILFLVGQGLESPSAVPELLDVSKNPCRPTYEMASDAPLVLWNCVYPEKDSETREDAMEWIYAGDLRQARSAYAKGAGKYGAGGVVEDLWSVWRQRKMDEILAGSLLDLVLQQGDQSVIQNTDIKNFERERQVAVERIFNGGNGSITNGKYVPLMQKRKLDTVEVQNARYLAAKQRKMEKGAQAENLNS
ncbi:pseudouridine synthase DEG1 [Aspergillus undulatus]|uniref:pseudouridine synthase DEG1 n=1 Tax=Aspergillus undulatus TaxID=1810928 RepID=UPI003CCDFAF0